MLLTVEFLELDHEIWENFPRKILGQKHQLQLVDAVSPYKRPVLGTTNYMMKYN